MIFDGKTLLCLPTPCGTITVTGGRYGSVPFAVRKNGFDPVYESYTGRLHHTEHNYVLCVDCSRLEKGSVYTIALTGAELSVGGGDECTQCLRGTMGDYSIAIGAVDCNQWRKNEQLLAMAREKGVSLPPSSPPVYDRSEFVRYDVERLEDCSGFRFELLDDGCDEIIFPVAWIKNEHGEGEEAAEFWVI